MSTEPSPEAQEISRSIIGWSASVDPETAERMRANTRGAVERKIDEVFAPLRAKVAELEAEVERLRNYRRSMEELSPLVAQTPREVFERLGVADSKVRGLTKDKERLDWLDSHDAEFIEYGEGLRWRVWEKDPNGSAHDSDSLREAIDAARESAAQGDE